MCCTVLAIDGRIICHGIISSFQSASTSEFVKLLVMSLTHVSSAIASTRPLPLPLSAVDCLSL